LAHGEFLPWLKENVPFAVRTAQDYMRLHRYRDKCASLAHLQEAYRKIEEIETQERQSEGPGDALSPGFTDTKLTPKSEIQL